MTPSEQAIIALGWSRLSEDGYIRWRTPDHPRSVVWSIDDDEQGRFITTDGRIHADEDAALSAAIDATPNARALLMATTLVSATKTVLNTEIAARLALVDALGVVGQDEALTEIARLRRIEAPARVFLEAITDIVRVTDRNNADDVDIALDDLDDAQIDFRLALEGK